MNYVNEQNMQEILDGIARKIGQGGTGNGLQDWESNTDYAIDDIFVLNNQIYKVLIDFTSGATEGMATKINNIIPTAWTANTSYTAGDIIEHQDSTTLEYSYYDVTSNFTSGATFEVTAEMDEIELIEEYVPHHLTDAEKQDLISGFNPSGMGTSVQAVNITLWSGDYSTSNNSDDYSSFTHTQTLSKSVNEFDKVCIYIKTSVSSDECISTLMADCSDIVAHKSVKNTIYADSDYRAYISVKFVDDTTFGIAWSNVMGWTSVSITKIVGIKYINPNNYSTEEQVVGTWIDGKPLYQKTIIDTMPHVVANGTEAYKYIDISSLLIDKGINILGYVYISDGYQFRPINSGTNNFRYCAFTQQDISHTYTDSLYLSSSTLTDSEAPCYITLQYTKTTD